MNKGYILVIEDDKSIINFLSISLKTNNYKVDVAENGLTGISLFYTNKPDLILLDLGLPDLDGTEVLKQIRMSSNVPVIIISARGQDHEKVEALDLGADDFVTKPFSIHELLARIRVGFRKAVPENTVMNIYESGNLRIDFEERLVFVNDAQIHLTPIEYKMLSTMVKNEGKVLTHTFLQNEIWGYDNNEFQSLRVFMVNIRKKIDSDPIAPKHIITEVGVGYRFIG